MANRWNPSANGTVGLEWLVDQPPSSYVLDAASKGYAQAFPGSALSGGNAASIAAYAVAVSGAGKFGAEVYSDPLSVPPAAQYDTNYFGSNTSADFLSKAYGGDAWVTQAGAAATYTAISPGVDDTTYLKNVNGSEQGFANIALRGANATQTAGKRILAVEVHARVKVTSSANVGITLVGALVLGGGTVKYDGMSVQSQYNNGYVDYLLGQWTYNPSTGVPWTLADLNNIITTGGTDRFGLVAWWMGLVADSVRVSSVYLKVKWVPEDRLGYAYGDVSTTGWQTWSAKSTPNLITTQDSNLDVNTGATGSWTANANTTISNDTLDRGAPWTRSLKMLSTASGTFGATSGLYPCIPGKTYSAACFTNVTSGKLTTLAIQFVDSVGTTISTVTGSSVAGGAAWTSSVRVGPATAPANATQMRLIIQTTATAGSQTCYAQGIVLALDQLALKFLFDIAAGGASPSKIDGGAEIAFYGHAIPEYVVLRRISGTGTMSIPTLGPGSSTVGMPLGIGSYRPSLQDASGALLSLGAPMTDCTAIVANKVHNIEAANGPDPYYTQPYAQRVVGQVDTTNTVKAQITLPASTFATVRFVVAGAIDPPGAALTIKLKRTSDNVQAGGNAVINPTDLMQLVPPGGGAPSRTTSQTYIASFATTGANTAVQYYLEFSSPAPVGQGWYIYALDDMGYTNDSVSLDTTTFGLAVDGWVDPLNGGTQTRRNGMCCVQTVPAAPTNFAAVVS